MIPYWQEIQAAFSFGLLSLACWRAYANRAD